MRVLMLIVCVVTTGCLIPPDLSVANDGSVYHATCHCTYCFLYDPQTMQCLPGGTASKDTELYKCGDVSSTISQSSANSISTELRTQCLEHPLQTPPLETCNLAEIDFVGTNASSDFLDLPYGEATCNVSTPTLRTGSSTLTVSKASVTSSTITLSSPDGSGSTTARGTIEFIGGNCTSGSCPFRIASVTLEATNFSFGGTNIRSPFFENTTIGEGTYFAGSGVFTIPSGGMQVMASGTTSDGRKGVLATAATAGFGLLNPRTRALVFSQAFTAGDVNVDIQLVASIDNLMPRVDLESATQIECNAIGGADVTIPAAITDADGRRHTSKWSVDGVAAAVNVDTLSTFLSLGSHTVDVIVFDEDAGVGTATATVQVVDTTPPTVSVGELCLWPPNHQLFVIEPSMLHVTDACDAAPSITFVSGTSSQTEEGPGAGNTSNDLVVQPSSVCVRSERDGISLTGRTYTVTGTTTDSSQNTSTFTLPIAVPHSRARHLGCDSFGGEAVEEGDPRCVASSTTDPTVPANADTPGHDTSGTSGCDATGGGSGAMLLVALLVVRRRRR